MPVGPASGGLNLELRTRTQAVAEIASWVGKQDDPVITPLAGLAWDSAVRGFNGLPWSFNRVTQNITLVDQQREYPLNTDFRNPLSCNISDSSGRPSVNLPYKPLAALDKDYPAAWASTETGIPRNYTVRSPERDAVIIVQPLPITGNGAGMLVRVIYHSRIGLVTDGDTPLAVPQSVDEAIYWRAVVTFLSMRGAEPAKIQIAQAEATRLWTLARYEYQDFADEDLLSRAQYI